MPRQAGLGVHVAGERGSGTVLVLALCALLVAGALAVGVLAAALAARHRAGVAADLAALAAADVLVGRRGGDPCELARRVAQRNGAQLVQCVTAPGGAMVEASVAPRGVAGVLGTARARAHAGPSPRSEA